MPSPAPRTKKELIKLLALLEERDLLLPLEQIALAYNVTFDDVLSRARSRRIIHARDACIHHMFTHYLMSSTEIGKMMGLDHTSVLYARDRYLERDNGTLSR